MGCCMPCGNLLNHLTYKFRQPWGDIKEGNMPSLSPITTCGRRASWPGVTRMGELALILTVYSTGKQFLHSCWRRDTGEPALKMWQHQRWSCLPPISEWDGLGEGKMPSPLCPLPPVKGQRAHRRVMRMRELALALTICSTRKSKPCNLPGQHRRDNPVMEVEMARAGKQTPLVPICSL